MDVSQAMPGQLGGQVVTSVHELLGAQHVVGMNRSVHGVEDAHLQRETHALNSNQIRPC